MVRRFGLTQTVASVPVALVLMASLASGCGGNNETVLTSGAIELSDALAFRDGAPSISIAAPTDRAIVFSPFVLTVETDNLRLSAAGETRDGEGHLHVLIDQDCLSVGVVIERGSKVVDLSEGRSETELDLAPGNYDICVQVGDGFSTAVQIVDRVSVTVIDDTASIPSRHRPA